MMDTTISADTPWTLPFLLRWTLPFLRTLGGHYHFYEHTVDTTISADTPSKPTASANVVEVDGSPQIVRPSCFVTILPTAVSDNADLTSSKNRCEEERKVPERRGRCRSADRHLVGDGKGHSGGSSKRGQLTPIHIRRAAWRRRSVSLDSTRFRSKLQQLLMRSPPLADVTSVSADKGAFNST